MERSNFAMSFNQNKIAHRFVMNKKKDLKEYNILELGNGSSLVLTTNDMELINEIRQFMKY
jgi:hypothetical protein